MPRKKNWRMSVAKKVVKSGDGIEERSVGCDRRSDDPLADLSAMPSVQACLAKDEGLATPTGATMPVPLTDVSDISVMPSALQGCRISDGGKARPTCPSQVDGLVPSGLNQSVWPSEHMNLLKETEQNDLHKETESNLHNEPIPSYLHKETISIDLLYETVPIDLYNETVPNDSQNDTMLDTPSGHCETMLDSESGHNVSMLGLDVGCKKKNAEDSTKESVIQPMTESLIEPFIETMIEPDIDLTTDSVIDPMITTISEANVMSIGDDLSKDCYIATPVFNTNTLRPIGSDIFIQGSFNQAESFFSPESKGSQCTVNALCALIYAHYSNLHTRKDLDKVLLNGDLLYKKTIHDLQARGAFKSRLLTFDELPEFVNIFNKEILVTKLDVVSGVCTTQFATSYLPSLHQAIHTAFLNCSYLLVMIGSVCSAVFKMDGQYFFFDSHSHGFDGLSHENGTSILISFHKVEDLVTYMYAVYNSMLVDIGEQFDVLPVQFGNGPYTKKDLREKTGTYEETNDTVVTSEWKTVTHKKSKKSKRHLDNPSERGSTENANSKYNQTLIGKYFGDQKQKQQQKQIRNKSLTNRKEYLRLYKQKQRQSADFKKNEQERSLMSKRKARETSDFRKNEQEYSLVSKRKARESSDFKKCEKESKRKARESSEFKKNEKEYSLASKRKARESNDFKEREQEYSLASKRKARESNDFKEREQEYSLALKRKARESSDFKKCEKESKRKARESSEFKKNEKEYSLASKRKARESNDFKEREQEYSLASKRKARESSEFKKNEKEYSLASKRKARECSDFKKSEKESKRTARDSSEFKQKEIHRTAKETQQLGKHIYFEDKHFE